jgi:hypothetical protein
MPPRGAYFTGCCVMCRRCCAGCKCKAACGVWDRKGTKSASKHGLGKPTSSYARPWLQAHHPQAIKPSAGLAASPATRCTASTVAEPQARLTKFESRGAALPLSEPSRAHALQSAPGRQREQVAAPSWPWHQSWGQPQSGARRAVRGAGVPLRRRSPSAEAPAAAAPQKLLTCCCLSTWL